MILQGGLSRPLLQVTLPFLPVLPVLLALPTLPFLLVLSLPPLPAALPSLPPAIRVLPTLLWLPALRGLPPTQYVEVTLTGSEPLAALYRRLAWRYSARCYTATTMGI